MIQTDQDAFRQRSLGQKFGPPGAVGNILFYLTDQVLISHCGWKVSISFTDSSSSQARPCLLSFYPDGSTLVYEDVLVWDHGGSSLPSLSTAIFWRKNWSREPTTEVLKTTILQATLKKSKKPIKSALLDQNSVAGLGNIYVDEVLYRTKVHPARLGLAT